MVKSDTVRIDFSMTSLDYLRSKERNVNLGQRDSTRRWNPFITVTLADGSQYPYQGPVDFADPQVDSKTGTFSVRAEMPNPRPHAPSRPVHKSKTSDGCQGKSCGSAYKSA